MWPSPAGCMVGYCHACRDVHTLALDEVRGARPASAEVPDDF